MSPYQLRETRVLTLSLLVFFASTLRADASAQQSSPLVVARVRADGLLNPIATYRNGGWVLIHPDATIGIPAVSLPPTWHFTPFRGSPSRLNALRVDHNSGDINNIDMYDGWGVRTDLPGQRTEFDSYPIERVGLATSTSVPVRLFHAVAPDSPTHQRLRDHLRAAFDSAAPDARTRLPAARVIAPAPDLTLELRSLASSKSRTVLYEVVARRRFSSNEPYHDLTYFGWIIDDGTRIRRVDPHISLTDLDRGSAMPRAFGAVTLDGTVYVVGAISGYEEETPMIWKWMDTSLVPVLASP